MSVKNAWELMRFHRPVGIWLLWWPVAWALWTAYSAMPPLLVVVCFFIGTVVMRAAGCVMNDIVDRRIDLHVKRTRMRPLTCGKMRLYEAFTWLGILLFFAFMVLLQLPKACFYYAVLAFFLAMSYPFFKRFFPTPQMVLALAFSMGIPMVYAAAGAPMNGNMWLLLVINWLWVLAYDTIYACVDEADDALIGVHSTARYWGQHTKSIVVGLQIIVQLLWLVLASRLPFSLLFLVCWCIAGVNLLKQWCLLVTSSEDLWFRAFKLNAWYGAWMWLGLLF